MNILEELQRMIDGNAFYIRSGSNEIKISEGKGMRTLSFNGVVYSRINLNGQYTNEYWDTFLPLCSLSDVTDVLMIGLGGGTIAYQMKRLRGDRVNIDVVEIDRNMIDAMKHFLPKGIDVNMVIGEGAEYVGSTKNKYDVIILDAYVNSLIPEQFFSDKFIDDAYGALKAKGVLAVNYINSSNTEEKLDDFVRRSRKKFIAYELNALHLTLNRIALFAKNIRKKEMVYSASKAGMDDTEHGRDILAGYEKMREIY